MNVDDIAIKVENLSKRYFLREPILDEATGKQTNELWALKDVSFEIKKGESVGIIGPNGSGKSTLLKILAGVTKPTEGKITINGRVASILDIGAGFHPELSGKENVFLNGQIHGFSKKEIAAKFDEIVAFSGIEKFIDEPVKNYSNGMYLRLAFSIMAHLDFDIYLFDEVLSVGDAEFQMKSFQIIEKIKSKKASFCIAYHQMQGHSKTLDYNLEIHFGKLESKKTKNNSKVNLNSSLLVSLTVPNDSVIKSTNPHFYIVKTIKGCNLFCTEVFQFEKDCQKIVEINIKLAIGQYIIQLCDIEQNKVRILDEQTIEILENENSFKEFGNDVNSILIV